jgi:hypothetical protein
MRIDGQTIDGSIRGSIEKAGGQWRSTAGTADRTLHKHHGLTGPIDDAFLDSFVFVRPTGAALHEKVGAWSENELKRAIGEWRRVFRGEPRVLNDTEITDEDIAGNNLVLWGDPGSNRLLARILPDLPLRWTREELVLGEHHAESGTHAPILIFPNPLNPERYIVLNSGFTFREGSTTSNSLQTPKLPDWALIDLRTPPSPKGPGRVAAAGFFNDNWQMP